MNMILERKLASPAEIKEAYPADESVLKRFAERDATLKNILAGKDSRIVLIIGPCSADSEASVLDYVNRLAKLQEEVKEKIFIVPRVYTNKPRTTGDGYKGMLHQPDPTEKPDMMKGLIAIRELHLRAIKETGFTCADEMLYPENYEYLNDVLCYVAVGARSVENQQHRLVSSGISVPVGMKNPTSGDYTVMLNSITAAEHPHTFIYRGYEAHSAGNPFAHAILRGYVDKHGRTHPNYHYEDLVLLNEMYRERNLVNPAVMIDCNHSNSGKNPFEQERIVKEVLSCRKYNAEIKDFVKGFMIESYIEDGAQKIGGGVYGKSITDACLGWEKSERLVREIAELC